MIQDYVPQADTRGSAIYRDQHGRKWDLVLDMRTKPRPAPVSDPTPCDWKIRLPQYLRPHPSWFIYDDRERSIKIDYELALSKLQARHKYFNRERQRIAGEMYGDAAHEYCDQVEVDADGKRRIVRGKWNTLLRRKCGPPPAPIEFVKAMRAGNPWALGFTAVVPSWAVPLIPFEPEQLDVDDGIDYAGTDSTTSEPDTTARLTWPQFRKARRGEGMSDSDISEAWALYKDESLEEVPIG